MARLVLAAPRCRNDARGSHRKLDGFEGIAPSREHKNHGAVLRRRYAERHARRHESTGSVVQRLFNNEAVMLSQVIETVVGLGRIELST
jgi:hypothetical protein